MLLLLVLLKSPQTHRLKQDGSACPFQRHGGQVSFWAFEKNSITCFRVAVRLSVVKVLALKLVDRQIVSPQLQARPVADVHCVCAFVCFCRPTSRVAVARPAGEPTCPTPVAVACWLKNSTDLTLGHRSCFCLASVLPRDGACAEQLSSQVPLYDQTLSVCFLQLPPCQLAAWLSVQPLTMLTRSCRSP